MTNTDTLHVEPTPLGWVAYFDPEGLNGHGKTREEALTELLDQTDECWRRTMDERKEEARKAILRGEELNKWQDLAQRITGVDANDHGWLRAEVDRSFAKASIWIPVSERKPPRDPEPGFAAMVLLFFPGADDDDQYNLGYYVPGEGWKVHDGGGYYEEAVPPPTHWMLLPEVPK